MSKKMSFNRSPEESNLDRKVKEYIKTTYRQDAWFLKVVGSASQHSGIPDIICCIRGKFICIEDKREDGSGKVSKNQLIEIKKINKAGGHAIVSNNLEEIKKYIASIVE